MSTLMLYNAQVNRKNCVFMLKKDVIRKFIGRLSSNMRKKILLLCVCILAGKFFWSSVREGVRNFKFISKLNLQNEPTCTLVSSDIDPLRLTSADKDLLARMEFQSPEDPGSIDVALPITDDHQAEHFRDHEKEDFKYIQAIFCKDPQEEACQSMQAFLSGTVPQFAEGKYFSVGPRFRIRNFSRVSSVQDMYVWLQIEQKNTQSPKLSFEYGYPSNEREAEEFKTYIDGLKHGQRDTSLSVHQEFLRLLETYKPISLSTKICAHSLCASGGSAYNQAVDIFVRQNGTMLYFLLVAHFTENAHPSVSYWLSPIPMVEK